MSGKNYKPEMWAGVLILFLAGGMPWLMTQAQSAQNPTVSEAKRDKILTYIRERFGVSPTVKLTLDNWHSSAAVPGFDEATVSVSDGKNQRSQTILVSDDSRFLITVTGNIIDLPQNSTAEMTQRLRENFKIPATTKVSIGVFKRSASPEFEQAVLTMDDPARPPKQERTLLITRDRKHLVLSEIYNLGVDPRLVALRSLSLHDEPSQGPADAPVTLVEFADLECPMCARMHEFLENQVRPRYGDKIRIVFKEFPLRAIHDWSYTAAIACQCAYEMNPASYVPLRSAIFRNQQLINITNLRDSLLTFGEQAGLDRVKLAACIDAGSSVPRIQRDMAEAKRLDVVSTPTAFINGKMIVGLPSEDAYYQAIDEALREHR